MTILWTLSSSAPFTAFGWTIPIPGYLVWGALLYAVIGTALTHLIGWRLIGLNFTRQKYEADFRFNLVRVRENSEQIALLGGETAERGRLLDRFGRVVENFIDIARREKKLRFFTASYSQTSVIVPYVLASPAYFAGLLQLGGLMQTASAFDRVQGALSYFVTAYRSLAEWRAVIERLAGFDVAVAAARAAAVTPPVVSVVPSDGKAVTIDELTVRLPKGVPIVAAHDITVAPGERVLVTGPTGSGKSTLFRAIAGVWPFGKGTIVVPKDAKVMMLPQRPYFPIATLAAAVTYPAEPGTFSAAQLAEVLGAVGLPALVATARRGGALEPHAVARRAAAARHRPRHPASARLPVPRRGDRLAR